jgi:membrane metallo-endopeptidase-like protein 1
LRGRTLLEASKEAGDFESYQLIRDHYKACTNEEKLEELGVKPLKKMIKEFGGWPVLEGELWQGEDFKWWEWTYKMNDAGLGVDSVVGISLGADDKNASYRVLGLDQASPGLSREYLVKGFEDKAVQYYYQFMIDTAVLLGGDKSVVEKELKESLLFEIELANILAPREERRNATLLYNPTTLGELKSYEELPPSWTDYFKNLFKNTDVKITDAEKIVVTNFEYHQKLSDLLKKTEKRTLANYLAWSAAKTLLTYLNKEARDTKHRYEKGVTGIQESSPTWKRCVSEMGFNSFSGGGFGFIAGSMYAKKYFNKEAKAAMLEMTAYIRTAFKEDILENLEWMDGKTKKRARAKLEKMDQFIAYSDEFLVQDEVDGLHNEISVSPDDYLKNTLNLIKFWRTFYYNQLRDKIDPKSWLEHSLVTVVNAFYNPGQNNMEFPAGILQGVFFNANVPKYLNYAAIGAVIGHEITHGFDDQGKQRNEIGKLNCKLHSS